MITRPDERADAIAALAWDLTHIVGELDQAVQGAVMVGHSCAVPLAASAWALAHLVAKLEAEPEQT